MKDTKTVAALAPGKDGVFWRRATWGLVVGVAVVRILFLLFVSPYELTGDEAHYWEWSRRPSLSYYSKGPGVAWTIWGATKLFGDAEWAVRLPAVVFGAVGALAVAGLGRSVVRESEKRKAKSENETGEKRGEGFAERVGFVAAGMFCLIPAYQAIGLLMTIDGGYVACWAVAALLGWMAIVEKKRWALVGCAAALGVGFLFKYTILLLVVGLVGAWVFGGESEKRKAKSENEGDGQWTMGNGVALVAALVVFAAVISPVIVWNWQHEWPTVKHLLGHLGAKGGDQAAEAKKPWSYDPLWTLEFIGTQIGMIGPLVVLMVMGCISPRSARRNTEEDRESVSGSGVGSTELSMCLVSSVAKRFCVWCAAPIVVFYFFTSFVTDVEGNWPMAGYVTLLPLAAVVVVREVERLRGVARKRSLVRGLWHGAIIYGVVAGVGMLSLGWLAKAPGVGKWLPSYRLTGARDLAARVEAVRAAHPGSFVAASRYDTASLLAYYLPGQPSVRSATSLMGGRKSSYDYFEDTRFDDARIEGMTAVLVGGSEKKWARALAFDEIRTIEEEREGQPAIRLGVGYRGVVKTETATP